MEELLLPPSFAPVAPSRVLYFTCSVNTFNVQKNMWVRYVTLYVRLHSGESCGWCGVEKRVSVHKSLVSQPALSNPSLVPGKRMLQALAFRVEEILSRDHHRWYLPDSKVQLTRSSSLELSLESRLLCASKSLLVPFGLNCFSSERDPDSERLLPS